MLLDAFEAIGGDVNSALRTATLEGAAVGLRNGWIKELPRTQFARLAQICVTEFDRHSHFRDRRPHFPPRHLRMLCLVALACPTLEIAIRNAFEYYAIVMKGTARLELRIDKELATVAMNLEMRQRSVGDLLITTFGLTNFHRFFGWLIGGEMPLSRVTLSFPVALEESGMSELLQIRPEFDCAEDSISFPVRYLHRAVVRDYHEFEQLFTLFPFDLLPPDYGAGALSPQVQAALHSAVLSGEETPKIGCLAKMFGLSEATFRRRLVAEGTSLTRLRQQCREEMAMELLANSRITITEIAERLQFNDCATFRRAFRAWKGYSPSQVRRGNESAPPAMP